MSNTTVTREEIIESLVAQGMSVDDAAAAYEETFSGEQGGLRLPLPLIKVNNDATIAPMGALVAEPTKNEDGDVEGYATVYDFADVEVLILERRATYSAYDSATGRTTVKTTLKDTYAKMTSYTDSATGTSIAELRTTNDAIKYQQLIVIGVRKRGTEDAFTFYNMYLKGTILYGINQLLDTCVGSSYPVLQIATKTSKKGSVKYTEIVLDNSVAFGLPTAEVLKNVSAFLDVKSSFNEYVSAYNVSLEGELAA